MLCERTWNPNPGTGISQQSHQNPWLPRSRKGWLGSWRHWRNSVPWEAKKPQWRSQNCVQWRRSCRKGLLLSEFLLWISYVWLPHFIWVVVLLIRWSCIYILKYILGGVEYHVSLGMCFIYHTFWPLVVSYQEVPGHRSMHQTFKRVCLLSLCVLLFSLIFWWGESWSVMEAK